MRWVNVSQQATDAGELIVQAMLAGDGQSPTVARLIDDAVESLDAADVIRGLGNLSTSLVTVLAMQAQRRPLEAFAEFVQVDPS
jgi:2-phospho-L-lactate transferase/gluconeogenesis factor (CofD/UPF0052 family)